MKQQKLISYNNKNLTLPIAKYIVASLPKITITYEMVEPFIQIYKDSLLKELESRPRLKHTYKIKRRFHVKLRFKVGSLIIVEKYFVELYTEDRISFKLYSRPSEIKVGKYKFENWYYNMGFGYMPSHQRNYHEVKADKQYKYVYHLCKTYDLKLTINYDIKKLSTYQSKYLSSLRTFKPDTVKSQVESKWGETSYKEGWNKLLRLYGNLEGKTIAQVFGFKSNAEARKWINWYLKWEKRLNEGFLHYDHNLFLDHYEMNKLSRENPLFTINYRKYHDFSSNKEKKQYQIAINKIKNKKYKIDFFRVKTLEELEQIGNEMKCCFGRNYGGYYENPDEFLFAKINDFIPVAARILENKIVEIRSFDNIDVPNSVRKQFYKEIGVKNA